MEASQPTLAPFAHVMFCKRNPADCQADGRGDVSVQATPQALQTIRAINGEVNRAIRAVNDPPGPLGDVWTLAPKKGDCDDYAVTKRHRLIAAGIPVAALRLVVARTRSGEGHAVVLVRTNDGDLVLDNRTSKIRPWGETDLTLMKLQSGEDPRRWVAPDQALALRR
ncbi:hypothetical protein GCM10011390_19790 [Aureimonas endophytica]|uniref:Transglutaminase-like cysteine proteinase n=1 Tax=Aureimonas endophytica TaxID=2027858 RepID=A0A916ZJB5_9HYPH|nr:transglutaminase-like cysteine peptidase [Aureimonas endophytica]GGE00983.1 hypothetical protein GCM10011390_19790 [Aureimonas endophytica]